MKESTTAALVLVFVLASADAARAQEHSEINFGDDSSRYANDGECDDSRFIVTGGARTGHPAWSTSAHARRDATDCRAELEAGSVRWPTASERWDRFRLWTACSDVNLEVLWPDLKEDQGTRLETIIRSRLRSARIFGGTENRVPVFNVTVEIGYGNMVFYDTTSSLSKWSTDTTNRISGLSALLEGARKLRLRCQSRPGTRQHRRIGPRNDRPVHRRVPARERAGL